jgi:hypothetical protein
MKKWSFNHNGNVIVAETGISSDKLYVNEELQDERAGNFIKRRLRGVTLCGKFFTDETREVSVGIFGNVKCKVFTADDITPPKRKPPPKPKSSNQKSKRKERREPSKPMRKAKSRLPAAALFINFAPAFLILLCLLLVFLDINSLVIFYIIAFSAWSFYIAPVYIIGIITAIFALCTLSKGKKRIGKAGIILSITAVIWPFAWTGFMVWLYNNYLY